MPPSAGSWHDGLVFTVEPFLSLGATFAEDGDDPWTLYSQPRALTVQYEHTVGGHPKRAADPHHAGTVGAGSGCGEIVDVRFRRVGCRTTCGRTPTSTLTRLHEHDEARFP